MIEQAATRSENPLREGNRLGLVPEPLAVVIFGATGDLTGRKLVPALFRLAVENRLPVAVFSMEMSGEQVAMRLLGSLARVSQHKIRTGRVEEEDWSRVTRGRRTRS